MNDDPHIDPTEEPTREQPAPEPDEPRRLTRSGSDAVIGGVASGLGRYFGIDPILFRIGFVVSFGLAAGCADPETIATYKVPKQAETPESVRSAVV